MKEKIGMEKLMKYVEEMQKEGINICRPRFQEYYLLEMMLVSKHYGLIKWLVENDKIDLNKVKDRVGIDGRECDISWHVSNVIMSLSISDTPIEDLLLYLK